MDILWRRKSHSFPAAYIQSSINMESVCSLITFHWSLYGGGEERRGILSLFFLTLLSCSSGFIQIRKETAQKLYFSCKKKTKQKTHTDSTNTQKKLCSENFRSDKNRMLGSICLYFIYNIKTAYKTKTKPKTSTNA